MVQNEYYLELEIGISLPPSTCKLLKIKAENLNKIYEYGVEIWIISV